MFRVKRKRTFWEKKFCQCCDVSDPTHNIPQLGLSAVLALEAEESALYTLYTEALIVDREDEHEL